MPFTSYAQNLEDVMLWRALRQVGAGFYIDVGAQDPVIDSVSMAFHERGWRGVHVEPNPHYADMLRAARAGDIVVQAAVNDTAGLISFYVIPNSGISTADAQIAEQHRERGFTVERTVVASLPLSAIFDACEAEEIHWLKLDVEGFEVKALSSWGDTKRKPWIVVVESTLPLTQIDTSSHWESMLLDRGYEAVYFDGLNRFYLSQDKLQLRSAFESPPNVFDDFSLSGTTSSPLSAVMHRQRHAELERLAAEHRRTQDAYQAAAAELESQLDLARRLQREALEEVKTTKQHLAEVRQHAADFQSAAAAALNDATQRAIEASLQAAETHRQEVDSLRSDSAERWRQATASLEAASVEHASNRAALELERQRYSLGLQHLMRELLERERQAAVKLAELHDHYEGERTLLSERHADAIEQLREQAQFATLRATEALQALRAEHQTELRAEIERRISTDLELASFRRGWCYRLTQKLRAATTLRASGIETNAQTPVKNMPMVQPLVASPSHLPRNADQQTTTYLQALPKVKAMKSRGLKEPVSIEQLLQLDDEEFIYVLYETLLAREPDASGFESHLGSLRRGTAKERLIVDFAHSAEGRQTNAQIIGLAELVERVHGQGALRWFAWLRRAERERRQQSLARHNVWDNRLARLQIGQSRMSAQLEEIKCALATPAETTVARPKGG